jgi:hypothetical protein
LEPVALLSARERNPRYGLIGAFVSMSPEKEAAKVI